MEALPIDIDTEIVTKYNLDEEQEKKEIVRHYLNYLNVHCLKKKWIKDFFMLSPHRDVIM